MKTLSEFEIAYQRACEASVAKSPERDALFNEAGRLATVTPVEPETLLGAMQRCWERAAENVEEDVDTGSLLLLR